MTEIRAVCLLLLVATISTVSTDVNNVVSMFHGDEGSLTNCGSKESAFSLKWSPRVLKTGIDLTLDVAAVAVDTYSHGDVCVTVWLKGVPDPIYQDCHDQQCLDAYKIVKNFLPDFECPIRKGYKIGPKHYVFPISPTLPLPSGNFHVNVTVSNENKVQLFCITGDIEIQDD